MKSTIHSKPFFVLDKSANRIERKVKVKVVDAENLDEKDKLLFVKYRNTLVAAKTLIDRLDENHEVLTKTLKQAKKVKKTEPSSMHRWVPPRDYRL